MKAVIKGFGIVTILFAVVVISGVFYISRGLEEGLNLKINPVNLSVKEDGVYKGRYDFGRWSNELKVTVKNHKITNIVITDDMMIVDSEVRGVLLQSVIEEQNTIVDAVSGGTVSCRAYLKSVENALNNE